MTPATLAIATGSSIADAEKYCQPLNEAMIRFGITTPRQRAVFIGQVDVESANLSAVEESLYYRDAARLAAIYKRVFFNDPVKAAPYVKNSAKLGQLLYQGYWGRGLIQLTWLSNYQAASKGLGFDYVSNPKLLTEPWHAAMSAAWFWNSRNCNDPAIIGDVERVTELINGPKKLHLAERQAAYASALKAGV